MISWTWKYPREIRPGDTFNGQRVTATVQQEDGTWAIVLKDGERVLCRTGEEMLRVIPGE